MVTSGTILMSMDPVFIRLSGAKDWDTAFLFGLFTFMSMSALTQLHGKGGIKEALRTGGLPIYISGMLMGGSGTTLVLAVNHTLVANAVLLQRSASPIFAPVFSLILMREKTSRGTLVAVFFAIAGIYIIIGGSVGQGSFFGDLMAIICAGFSAMNYVLWRKYPDISRTMVIALGGLAIALISAFAADPAHTGWRTWAVMMVMGLVSAPIGRVLLSTSARYISATEISLFSLLRTIIAPLAVWLIFAEIPPAATFAGGGLILLTLAVHAALTGRHAVK